MTWSIVIAGTPRNCTVKKIEQTLNGYEEVLILLPNNSTNRTLVDSDQSVVISWDGTVLFYGTLKGADFTPELITAKVYDAVIEKMAGKDFTGDYTTTAANTILSAICAKAGVTIGACPATGVSVKFLKALCSDSAMFLAQALTKDFYTTNGTTFNIGTKGTGVSKGTFVPVEVPKRGIDRYLQRNHVWVKGIDPDGGIIWGEAKSTGWSEPTDRPVTMQERKATDVATLNAIAASYLAQFEKESSGVKLPLKFGDAVTLQTGDIITINQPEYDLSGDFRIWKITKTADSVLVEIDVAEAILEQYVQQKTLEDIGIYYEAGTLVVESGTAFPSPAYNGQLFYRTDLYACYRYNGSGWEKVARTSGYGTSYPAEPSLGDLFYRSDLNQLHRYISPGNWQPVTAISTSGTNPPGNPKLGDFFYNTDTHVLFRYAGPDGWIEVLRVSWAGAGLPPGRFIGDLYYSTDYEQTFYWNGSNWTALATTARSGTSFPANKVTGDIFYRTDENLFYRFNGTDWEVVHPKIGAGSSFPTTPAPKVGDLWYRTDQNILYRHNGTTWVKAVQITYQATGGWPTTPPPVINDLCYRTDLDKFYRFNGSIWEVWEIAALLVVPSGTTWPSPATIGELFYHLTYMAVFRYNGSTWDKVVQVSFTGATAPPSPSVGDLWYSTNDNTLYRFDGANWKSVHCLSTSGTGFPANPKSGDFFYNTNTGVVWRYDTALGWKEVLKTTQYGATLPTQGRFVGDLFYSTNYEQTFYWEGGAIGWRPLTTVARYGSAWPTDKVNGDLFYRTDLNEFYRYELATDSWLPVHPRITQGSSFPTNPHEGDLFFLTNTATLYRRTSGGWQRVVITSGSGTSYPTAPNIGDLFFRTDLNVMYRYIGGGSWAVVSALSGSGTGWPSNPRDGDFFYRTDQGVLYRYRSDIVNWVEVLTTAQYGAALPTTGRFIGDVFYSTNYEQTFVWEGAVLGWVALATIARVGSGGFPTPAVEGDICYRSDLNQFYRYNGSGWDCVHPRIRFAMGAFPTDPQLGDVVYRTDENILYRYDGPATLWVRIVQVTSTGATNPVTGMKIGDLFYNTTIQALYRYSGSAWQVVHHLSSSGTSPPATGNHVGDFYYHTTDKQLLRWDGTAWLPTLKITQTGAELPEKGRFIGDLFYSGLYEQTFYWTGISYAWVPLATIARQGSSWPSDAVDGDIFYRTDEQKFYRYQKTPAKWVEITLDPEALPQDNLIANGSFEIDRDEDGIPDYWTLVLGASAQGAIISTESIEGAKCAEIYVPNSPSTYGYWQSDFFTVEEGYFYFGRVKAKNVSPDFTGGMANLSIEWYDKDKVYLSASSLGSYSNSALLSWTDVGGKAVKAVAGARFGRMICKLQSYGAYPGKTRFDSCWVFKRISWDDIFDEENAISTYSKRWQGESDSISKVAGTTVFPWSECSGGNAIQRLKTEINDYMWYGPYAKLGAGEFYAIFALGCKNLTAGQGNSNLVRIDVYSATGGGQIAVRQLTANHFGTVGSSWVWKTFAIRFNIKENWSDLEIRGIDFKTGIADVAMDWVGIVSASVPVDKLGASIGPDTTGMSIPAAPSQTVAAAVDDQTTTWKTVYHNTSTEVCHLDVPGTDDVNPYIVHYSIYINTDMSGGQTGVESFRVRLYDGSQWLPGEFLYQPHNVHMSHALGAVLNGSFVLPYNAKGKILRLYFFYYDAWVASIQVATAMGGYGGSPHYHVPSEGSGHTSTLNEGEGHEH